MSSHTALTDSQLVELFTDIRTWKAGGVRAPHKPLLLLLALARAKRGEQRLISFKEVEDPLKELLRAHGPHRQSYHPEYPFWHLQSDGLWDIPQRAALEADLKRRTRQNNPPKSVLLREGAEGGFPPAIHQRLAAEPELIDTIAQALLETSWPPSYHEAILDAVGMPWVATRPRRNRDPAFRNRILVIYDYRCAVCGWDGRLGSSTFALEAAHIRWHAAGGDDHESNGLALCTLHHQALDRGALGLDHERRIRISRDVNGHEGVQEWLVRYAGAPLRGPQPGTEPPHESNIKWHAREVFRGDARAAS